MCHELLMGDALLMWMGLRVKLTVTEHSGIIRGLGGCIISDWDKSYLFSGISQAYYSAIYSVMVKRAWYNQNKQV